MYTYDPAESLLPLCLCQNGMIVLVEKFNPSLHWWGLNRFCIAYDKLLHSRRLVDLTRIYREEYERIGHYYPVRCPPLRVSLA